MNMDNEYSFWSRKFIMTIIGAILLCGMTFIANYFPVVVGLYPTFVGGLIAILSLYLAGNITNKYVVGKSFSLREKEVENDPELEQTIDEEEREAQD